MNFLSGMKGCLPLLLCLSLFGTSSASTFISDSVFGGQMVPSERRLLQVKTKCPVDIENLNYTILTSQCKGPPYMAKPCCDALKQLMCPNVNDFNDQTNNCATRMFSYIDNNGYEKGQFASLCSDLGKIGMSCPALPPDAGSLSDTVNDGAAVVASGALWGAVVSSLGVLLL